MRRIVTGLVETLGARGAMVFSRDGLPIVSVVGKDAQVDRLAAMGAAILSDVKRSLDAAGMADFAQCEVAAEQGKVILVAAGPVYLLVLTGPRIELGPGSVEIRSAALQVEKAAQFSPA